MSTSRRRYSQEFKDQLCEEVVSQSKTIRSVADAYGIGAETLRNWVKKYKAARGEDEAQTPLSGSERARLAELERENQQLRAEAAFLKKSGRVLRAGATVVAKYEFIDSQRKHAHPGWTVVNMCAWLEVSKSGYYNWRFRPQSATAARRQALTARVRHFFEESDGTYGYRRIHADLADEGTEASPELVRQIMRDEALYPDLAQIGVM
nr:hypothetical protein GCM10023233_19880 [Brevibacterium otitidis]